jgi:hypothetical protein
LETLGYNLVTWAGGKLPWEGESDDNKVHAEKTNAFKNTSVFLKKAFGGNVRKYIETYFKFVSKVAFLDQPNYKEAKKIFVAGLKEAGLTEKDKLLVFPCKRGKSAVTAPTAAKKRKGAAGNDENVATPARRRVSEREPRSVSISPVRTPLKNRQRNNRQRKSGSGSPVSTSSTPMLFPSGAMDFINKHPDLKKRFMNKQRDEDTDEPDRPMGRRGSSDGFRRDSEVFAKRLEKGVHKRTHQALRSDSQDSNTIAGCSPSPRHV